jgi:crossover junction endodeoxyribonuclease RuvC
MSDGIKEIIISHNPDVASIEKAFVGKNANTALILGHARGVLMLAAHQGGASIKEFSPTQIKKAVVGNGHADKSQVEFMVRALLQLTSQEIKDDAFDALGAAICAYNHK